jgi:hypothetical protein
MHIGPLRYFVKFGGAPGPDRIVMWAACRLRRRATLNVSVQRHRLYAELGQRSAAEMVPVGEYRYVAPGQRMTIEFNPLPFDGEVRLTYPADLAVAGSAMVTARTGLR